MPKTAVTDTPDQTPEQVYQAYRAEQDQRILTAAPSALDNATGLRAALAAAETALTALAEGIHNHNAAVTYWSREISGSAADGLTTNADRTRITVGGRAYAHLNAGRIGLSLLHRALADHPEHVRGRDLRPGADPYGLRVGRQNGSLAAGDRTPADLADVIGRAA